MARKTSKNNLGAHVYWRNHRAYGDFREYEDVGGGREALSLPGSTWGTKAVLRVGHVLALALVVGLEGEDIVGEDECAVA